MHDATDHTTVAIPDVQFGIGGDRPLSLDILRPEPIPDAPIPAVIYIHGGGWERGTRKAHNLNQYLNGYGFFTVAIEYRLSGEAIFPAQIEDCKAAVRWLRARATEYHLDPERIGVWGHSAGGHLASLLGTSGDVPELEGRGGNAGYSTRVQAVITLSGPTDLTQMGGTHDEPGSPEAKLLGGPVQERHEAARRANPITYVGPGMPPFLLIHGDQDRVVPIGQAELLYTALRVAGNDATFQPIAGANHSFNVEGVPRAFFDAIYGPSRAFFREHLMSPHSYVAR